MKIKQLINKTEEQKNIQLTQNKSGKNKIINKEQIEYIENIQQGLSTLILLIKIIFMV